MSQKNKLEYVQCRKMYKELIKQKKREHNKEMSVSLSSNLQNPEMFWKQIRKLCGNYSRAPSISVQDWYEHFTTVFCETAHKLPDEWE